MKTSVTLLNKEIGSALILKHRKVISQCTVLRHLHNIPFEHFHHTIGR